MERLPLVVTALIVAVCRLTAAQYHFTQIYRVPAGKDISIAELTPAAGLQITSIDIHEGDYPYCDNYRGIADNINYILVLHSQLNHCVQNSTCSAVKWLPSKLFSAKCRSREMQATAIVLRCNYVVDSDVSYITAVEDDGELKLNVTGMWERCSGHGRPSVNNLLVVDDDQAIIANCSKQEMDRYREALTTRINSCVTPCESLTISSTEQYGCSMVSGAEKTNNLTLAKYVRQVAVFYSCVNDTQSMTISIHSTTIHPPADQWRTVAIIFIALFSVSLLAVIGLSAKLCRDRSINQKEETNNNNNVILNHAKTQTSKPPAVNVRPYATHTIVRPSPKQADREAPKPRWYADAPSRTSDNSAGSTVQGEVETDSFYEPVDTSDKPPPGKKTTALQPPTSNHLQEVDPGHNRISAASYVVFDPE